MASPYRSPYKNSVSPPLPPPKAIDLNSSTRSTDHSTGSKVTRRAFHCDVIIENEGPETRNLLSHLGAPIEPSLSAEVSKVVDFSGTDDPARLPALVEELIKTERSYISRIMTLKTAYADPLRSFAKRPESMIIPVYEAKALFANIDQVCNAAVTFMLDLDKATPNSVADICLRHLASGTFDPYRSYLGQQDASQQMFQNIIKKFPSFISYIESTKYSTTGIGNIGLRELLMEPVQRVPRYTLLWSTMIKCYPIRSAQRSQLAEAIGIASKIAKCEPNEHTIRATVLYCLERNVEGFPANLFNNNRTFIDSIDVDEPDHRPNHASTSASLSSVSTASSSATSNAGSLHCTLFLFDDKLMVVKRQSSSISGRKVTGLDDMPKLVKSGGGVAVMDKLGSRKDKLSFRGAVDILDVIVTDVGNGDFNLFLEKPPDQSERWARQLRCLHTVHPPYSHLDPVAVKRDKLRFVENLWAAQAKARKARGLVSEDIDLDEPFQRARCYWSLFDRMPSHKGKVLMHIEEEGTSPDIPMGDSVLAFRVQAMPGGFTRFSYRTATGEEDRQVIDVSEVLEKTVSIIHKLGIFRFRTSISSAPNTPSSSHRLRPSMLHLDTLSRNLFGTGSVNSRDRSSTLSSNRSKSQDSRLSAESKRNSDQSLSPGPYRMYADKSEVDLNERLNIARKNSNIAAYSPAKPPKSPLNGLLPCNVLMPIPPDSPSRSPGPLVAPQNGEGALMENTPIASRVTTTEDKTEMLRQAIRTGSPVSITPTAPLRVRNRSPSPVRTDGQLSPRLTGPRSPVGPRGQSMRGGRPPSPCHSPATQPLAIPTAACANPTSIAPRPGPQLSSSVPITPAKYPGLGSSHTRLRLVSGGGRKVSPGRETVPLREEISPQPRRVSAKRQLSEDHLQAQPRKRSDSRSPLTPVDVHQVTEPSPVPSLSIKRGTPTKLSVSIGPHTPSRNNSLRSSISEKEYSIEHADAASAIDAARLKITESRVTAKRIRTEIGLARKQSHRGSITRSPQRRNITRLVDSDFELSGRFENDSSSGLTDDSSRGLMSLAERLEAGLRQALADIDQSSSLAARLLEENAKATTEVQRLHEQVSRAKEVQDMLRSQLAEATVEIDVVYEAFNTELDGMYNDACLPQTEAFKAMKSDLQSCKSRRNELDLENQRLKRELAESNLKREQWARILKVQGIIP